MSLFRTEDYREILRSSIELNGNVRGYKKILSHAAGCHASYLSKVLRYECELTPDHGLGLCEFWEFDEPSTLYFLTTLDFARAATQKLKEHLRKKLENLRKDHDNLSKVQGVDLQDLKIGRYYETWLPAAVHVAVSVKKYQTVQALVDCFHQPVDVIAETLDLLHDLGLVERAARTRFVSTKKIVHVPRQSLFAWQHLANWRQRSLADANRSSEGFHYTNIVSLSKNDAIKLRKMTMDFVDATNKVIEKSEEETLMFFNFDCWTKI